MEQTLPNAPTVLKHAVQLLAGPADDAETAWPLLRGLLLGRSSIDPNVTGVVDGLVQAAKNGEIVALAAHTHPALAAALEHDVRRQALVDMHLELALKRVTEAFSAAGIDQVSLLKGSASAYMLYPKSALRVRRDIDVLVAPAQFLRAIGTLADDGWIPNPGELQVAKGPSASRDWPMVLDVPMGQLSCDLHQRLFPGARFRIDTAGILARANPASGPAGLPVPALEDLFLHTAIHIGRNAFLEPLKAWWDLVLITRQAGFSWANVEARAIEWHAKVVAWAVLTVLARWFEVAPPKAMMRRLRPERWRRRLLSRLLSGDNGFPLRRHIRRLAATAVFAPLLSDNFRALADYGVEVLTRRVEKHAAAQFKA